MSVDRCRCIFNRKSTEGRHWSDFYVVSYGRLTKNRFFLNLYLASLAKPMIIIR